MTGEQKVYFIQGPPDGPIKIGISVNPEERLRTFQTASPYRLRILRLEPGGRSRETALHRRWRRHRLEGEWFNPAPAILDYIATAPNGYAPRLPVLPSFGWLAVIPRGAWRILLALILSVFGKRRRRREVRPLALLGLAAPATGAGLTIADVTDPNVAIYATVAVLIVACTIAGTVRA